MARSGLKKVVKTVKGKKKSVRRTYWVKSESPKKKGLGPGGMIKRGGLYHRIDQSIGRASPLKKGLIAAGTVAGMLALAGGAVYAGSAMRGASRKQAAGSATTGPVGGSTLEGMHRSMGGSVRPSRSPQAQNKLSPTNKHPRGYALAGFAPASLTGLRVATPADARAARHVPYTHAHKRGRAGDMGWFDNLTHL
jgi:hypothetical protein